MEENPYLAFKMKFWLAYNDEEISVISSKDGDVKWSSIGIRLIKSDSEVAFPTQ